MTRRSLILAGVLALGFFTLAIAKSYDISVNTPTTVGTIKLEPGRYTLEVKGDAAIFKTLYTNKPLSTPVKIETSDKKFDYTQVNASTKSDGAHIVSIGLAGSKTLLTFE